MWATRHGGRRWRSRAFPTPQFTEEQIQACRRDADPVGHQEDNRGPLLPCSSDRRLIAAVALLFLGALPAVAGKDDSRAPIAPPGPAPEVGTNAALQPIVNCEGWSNRPHASGHVRGTVNAQGQSKCPYPYPTIYVFSELYKSGTFLDREQAFANNRSLTIATVNVTDACPRSKTYYQIKSYHYVVWPDLQDGFANTSNAANVECKKK